MIDPATQFLIQAEDIPKQPEDVRRWHGLQGAAFALAIHETALAENRCILIIAEHSQSAQRLQQELAFFSGRAYPIDIFPDYETLIYDGFSPHQDILSDRLALLSRAALDRAVVIVQPQLYSLDYPPGPFYLAIICGCKPVND